MGHLPDLDPPDVTLWDKATKVDLGEIEERHNWRAGLNDLARLGGSSNNGAGKRRDHGQVLAIGVGLGQLKPRLLRASDAICDFRLLLDQLLPNCSDLRLTNARIGQTGLGGCYRGACRLDPPLRASDRGLLLIGRRNRQTTLAFRDGAGRDQMCIGVFVEQSELERRLLPSTVGLAPAKLRPGFPNPPLPIAL